MLSKQEITENFVLRKLNDDETVCNFDCGDSDLNEFITEEAIFYKSEFLAIPYIFYHVEKPKDIVAYFTLSNDKISISDFASNSQFNKFKKQNFNVRKRLKSYPSVKIGRFAVSTNYNSLGLGSHLIEFIKSYYLEENKAGCRFITVDAYRDAIPFYIKNGFEPLQSDDGSETQLLYFDLKNMERF